MTKIVSVSQFKAECLQLINDIGKSGQSLTLTKRGKVVAEVKPPLRNPQPSRFGSVKGNVRWFVDPTEPVGDLDDWAALR